MQVQVVEDEGKADDVACLWALLKACPRPFASISCGGL
jgi:hypothetical protein